MDKKVRLFHVSENSGIAMFEPRPASRHPGLTDDVVWAVDEKHLRNYILPRDCPRVTFYAGHNTDEQDVAKIIGPSRSNHVIAIEWSWLQKVRAQQIYVYEFDSKTFSLFDQTAGYYVSQEKVTPIAENKVNDILTALISYDVELRVLPSLIELAQAVANSTLEFSIIRMNR